MVEGSRFLEQAVGYIPEEWRYAIASGEVLPKRANGAALFADISGFTPLSEKLMIAFSPREGAERLPAYLNRIYDVLIDAVTRYHGSVVDFAGDSILCWFDNEPLHFAAAESSSQRACAAALEMQTGIQQLPEIVIPGAMPVTIGIKVSVASGQARRFLVGDPAIQRFALLAGDTILRVADGEHLAKPGEIWIDQATANALIDFEQGNQPVVSERGDTFFCLRSLRRPAAPCPWPTLALRELADQQVRPWLLPPVYKKLQDNLGEFLTELRPAVPLFLRFSGLNLEGDAQAGKKLDEFICSVQKVLDDSGGTLLQITIGDKGSYLYAVFGAPLAHEDDARRATTAALALRTQCRKFGDLDDVQIGITQGTLRSGVYGSSMRRAYGVLGDETNLAARLMSRASPGEILISNRVFQSITSDRAQQVDIFLFDPRPPVSMKGKSEPVAVFAVTGAHHRQAVRLQEPSYALPMVGRQAQLALIEEKIGLMLNGQGQVIGICADAGMGKSRLAAEVIRSANHKGIRCFGGACQSDAANTPYFVWMPIWRAFFDFNPDSALKRQIRSVTAVVEDYAPERVESIPLLGPLLGMDIPDNDFTAELEPQYMRMALEALLIDCLKGAAKEANAAKDQSQPERGLIFVLEDLHWVDPASLDLLERAGRACSNLPVLFLLAYRPPEIQQQYEQRVADLPNFTRLVLAELNTAEAEQAARAKFAQLYPEWRGEVPRPLISRVIEQAQGSPFYAEELLNYLDDQNVDLHDPQAVESLELPTSLQSLILSRIDRLTGPQQFTLKSASVIGRVFQEQVISGMLEREKRHDIALDQILPELQRRELILMRHGGDMADNALRMAGLEYIFKHIITLEVTYYSLLMNQRKILHRLAAEAIETIFSNSLAEHSTILADHYQKGEVSVKALHYLEMAALRAEGLYANNEAIHFFEKAITQLQEISKTEKDAALRKKEAELYEKLGASLALVGRIDDAVAAIHSAIGLTGEVDWQQRVRLYRQIVYARTIHREYEACDEAMREMEKVLGKEQDTSVWRNEWIEAKLMASNQCYWRNLTVEMRQLLDEVGPAVQQYGTPMQRSRYMENRYSLLLRVNRYLMTDGDLIWIEQGHQLAREIGDFHLLANIAFELGMAYLFANRLEDATAALLEGLEIARKTGDAVLELRNLIYLATTRRRHGNILAVEALLPSCIEASQRLQMDNYLYMAYGNQAWVDWKKGNWKTMAATLEAAWLTIDPRAPMGWITLLPGIALALHNEEVEQAIEYCRWVLEPHQKRLEEPLDRAIAQAIAGWEAGQREDARSALAEVLRLAEFYRYL